MHCPHNNALRSKAQSGHKNSRIIVSRCHLGPFFGSSTRSSSVGSASGSGEDDNACLRSLSTTVTLLLSFEFANFCIFDSPTFTPLESKFPLLPPKSSFSPNVFLFSVSSSLSPRAAPSSLVSFHLPPLVPLCSSSARFMLSSFSLLACNHIHC